MNIHKVRKTMTRDEFLNSFSKVRFWTLQINDKLYECPKELEIENKYDDVGQCGSCRECWTNSIKDIKFKGEESMSLTIEQVKKSPEGTKFIAKCSGKECLVQIKGEKLVKENDRTYCNLNDEEEIKYIENIRLVEEKRTYKGWEILKMIDEGKLKEGDEYIRLEYKKDNEDLMPIMHFSAGKDKVTPGVQSLLRDVFIIKEKEPVYMTFDEARKLGIPKHKDINIGYDYGKFSANDFVKMMDQKVWEVRVNEQSQ